MGVHRAQGIVQSSHSAGHFQESNYRLRICTMVEHIVVRCCSCHMAQVRAIVLAHMEVMVRCCICHYGAIMVQVRQCTKVRKYACKMCGTPQSYGKVCVPPLHFKCPGAQGRLLRCQVIASSSSSSDLRRVSQAFLVCSLGLRPNFFCPLRSSKISI